ncbi:uncharacterized protein LOC106657010 [Trichogramma pretiosum]|uniref:Biogenesis of lysosome-related organelles complex 1 subunit 6 n=1 Tax=Trichogramma kaykai TaxID=54128 RepID=A0ABD2XEB6_9HYME|nr:uncharacterized protein LOC106657010 [Trichogramma pretiosum]
MDDVKKELDDLSEVSQKLAKGIVDVYEGPLSQVQQELNALTSKQETCITQMQAENKKMCDVQDDIELNHLFTTVANSQRKLLDIKTEIMSICDRTARLKKRALHLQKLKQKEIQAKAAASVNRDD